MTNESEATSGSQQIIPKELFDLMQHPDGVARLLEVLPRRYSCEDVADTALRPGPGSAHNIWESIGCTYMVNDRLHEATVIQEALYDHLLAYQEKTGKRAHKGAPLCWLFECHLRLQHPVIARRYLMLTACEDAILHCGSIQSAIPGGFYIRAVLRYGFSHFLLERYLSEIWKLHQDHPDWAMFPERIVQEIDQDWMTDYPTPQETAEYRITPRYVASLVVKLGDKEGRTLEYLAHYLVNSMPGCRAYMRLRSHVSEYDVTGAFEGPVQDFRSDIGRYFVCECKDWDKPADITAFAKFCRILDSTKCRFGILFSQQGVSGAGRTENAEREQLKMFQDRGVVVVVVKEADLKQVVNGANFITMLKRKYEAVRLDLR